jgi:hypothetical protein
VPFKGYLTVRTRSYMYAGVQRRSDKHYTSVRTGSLS